MSLLQIYQQVLVRVDNIEREFGFGLEEKTKKITKMKKAMMMVRRKLMNW